MGSNHHTPWSAGVTRFTAASMNPALSDLDRAITYHKLVMVSCDGEVSWVSGTGTLSWNGTIHFYFTRADGVSIHNSVAASSIALADDEYAYVTLSETNNQVLTVSKKAIDKGNASTFADYNICVLGFRNATDDQFYPVDLRVKIEEFLPAGVQALTCADSVTIDWTKGATATMTLDRASTEITLDKGVNGKVYRLLLVQDGTGSREVTWATTVKWMGGELPALTEDINAEDIITFIKIGNSWYASASLDFGEEI
jgi:FtsP/CotA-like multicopper oxidase with cupredoxin domain